MSSQSSKNAQESHIGGASSADGEFAYAHISDDELTMESDMANLKSVRKRHWGGIDSTVKSNQAKEPTFDGQYTTSAVRMNALPTTASVASVASAASAAAAAQAIKATKLAKKLARQAIASTTASGKTEILDRFINGSAWAPGQVLSWMSSGLSPAKANIPAGAATDATEDGLDSTYNLVIWPAGRTVTINSLYTIPDPISPFTHGGISTPPTSCSGSVDPSVTGLMTSTFDENVDPVDCDIMSAGTLFERNSTGAIVPVFIDDGFDEAENRNFEVVFDDKEDVSAILEEDDDDFCILASVPDNIN
ncbi:hypothetical protein SCUCBS95973_003276 [Sporothrix curviconia]|uniref:Uncharacterized protein n=1 Tax=Sporothrix curviconia TaxID=1260050 RepID=A0ABP0BDZ5_9PEZI